MDITGKRLNRYSQYSTILFQLGLVLVMLSTYFLINKKTKTVEYNNTHKQEEVITMDFQDAETPVTEFIDVPPIPPKIKLPPPPPPKPVVEVEIIAEDIQVIEKDLPEPEKEEPKKVIEEPVEVTKFDPDAIEDDDQEDEPIVVPFSVVKTAPIFPGCEKEKTNSKRVKCFEKKIRRFVNRKINVELAEDLGIKGTVRVNSVFKINSEGNVVDVKGISKYPKLVAEVERVLKLLPKIQPGKQQGKPVSVLYSLPVVFMGDED